MRAAWQWAVCVRRALPWWASYRLGHIILKPKQPSLWNMWWGDRPRLKSFIRFEKEQLRAR